MARRRRNPTGTETPEGERDTTAIAIPAGNASPDVTLGPLLAEIEDRRQFHPEQDQQPVRRLSRRPNELQARDRPTRSRLQRDRFGETVRSQTKAIVGFADPARTVVCIRRKQRREVLHAKKQLKKRGGGGRRRTNWRSHISCR